MLNAVKSGYSADTGPDLMIVMGWPITSNAHVDDAMRYGLTTR